MPWAAKTSKRMARAKKTDTTAVPEEVDCAKCLSKMSADGIL